MSKSILITFYSIVFLTCSFLPSYPQEDRPLRLEIPTTGGEGTYTVIPCETQGMLLFYQTTIADTGKTLRWIFLWLDQNLQQRWMHVALLPQNTQYKRFAISHNILYLLFFHPDKKKDTTKNLLILRVEGNNGLIDKYFIRVPGNPQIDQAIFLGNKLWFTVQPHGEGSPFIMSVEPEVWKSQEYRFIQDIPARMGSLKVDENRQMLLTTRLVNISKKQTGCLVQTISSSGQPGLEWMFAPTPGTDLTLRTCDCLAHEDGGIYTGGIYDLIGKKSILGGKDPTDQAAGFFAGAFSNGKEQFLTFYNFLEMNDLVKQLKSAKIQGGKELSIKRGSASSFTSLQWRTIMHPLKWNDHTLILQGDTYYPEYHTEYFTDYDFYGRPFTRTYSVFDGYRIQTAIMTGFNKNGGLEWDLALPVLDVVQNDTRSLSISYTTADETLLMYPANGMIVSKSIMEKDQVAQTDFSQISLKNKTDKLLTENHRSFVFWYDKYFLLYGYQELKNINKEDKKRWVFQITKIVLE